MKVLRLQTQGFKRIVAVDITPQGDVVNVGGDNAEGKTSLLDSIMAALGGADAAPIKPIRTGDEFAAIRVELGDDKPALIVTKYFDEVGEKLRVETADGDEIKAGQTKVSDLLGRMTFDPLEFARMKATDQGAELLRHAPLTIDLGKLAAEDKADVAARRDINRDAKALKARIEAIPAVTDLPDEKPDVDALTATLATAAEVNTAIERERAARERLVEAIARDQGELAAKRGEAVELRRRADAAEKAAIALAAGIENDQEQFHALPPLAEPVDTSVVTAAINEARVVLNKFDRRAARNALIADFEAMRVSSEGLTARMTERAQVRAKALAEAQLPVPGLSLARMCDAVPGEESEELIAVYDGEPFAQASGAQQLRVSMRLAMAANPKLRVMLIRDGSLLDSKGMATVREMAADGNYQVWLESVGEGDGTGLIMEAGSVRGAPEPEPLAPPKRRKPKAEGEAAQVVEASAGEVSAAAEPSVADKVRALGTIQRDPLSIADVPGFKAAQADTPAPPRRKPSAMSSFSRGTKPGADLFGDK